MAVASTAMCTCSFSMPPGVGTPTPLTATCAAPTVSIEGKPAATVFDFAPVGNIKPFGLCYAPPKLAQPGGIPTPCMPVPAGPWIPVGTPKVFIKGQPALTNQYTLACSMGGVITIKMPGTTHTQIK